MASPIQVTLGDQIPRRGNAVTRAVGLFFLRLYGWRITGTLPNAPKAVLIFAPHTSNLDGFMAAACILAMQLRLGVMAKSDIFRGLLGTFLRWLGGIPIDRSGAQNVVDQSVSRFQEREKLWVGIAPEGTRAGVDEWKSGFYRIAQKADIPMIVVVLDYKRRIVHFADTLKASGDMKADMERILACYRGVTPHHPSRMSTPLKNVNTPQP